MPSFNGHLATLIKGSSTGGEDAVLTGVSASNVSNIVPAKFMKRSLCSVVTDGVSGTYSVHVIAAIGTTFVTVGTTGIATNGITILGSTASYIPTAAPVQVEWASAEDSSGFTSSVFMAGDY